MVVDRGIGGSLDIMVSVRFDSLGTDEVTEGQSPRGGRAASQYEIIGRKIRVTQLSSYHSGQACR